jgi:hypothetical protein
MYFQANRSMFSMAGLLNAEVVKGFVYNVMF